MSAGLLGSLPGLLWFLHPRLSKFSVSQHTVAVPGRNRQHPPLQPHPGSTQVRVPVGSAERDATFLSQAAHLQASFNRTTVGYKHTWMLSKRYSVNMTYKIFCGWDFTIRDPDSAALKQGFIRNDIKVRKNNVVKALQLPCSLGDAKEKKPYKS